MMRNDCRKILVQFLQHHIKINQLEFNILFGALGMAMGPHQGLTKEHSKFPAEKINIFFVTFFRVKISMIGLNCRVFRVINITVHI